MDALVENKKEQIENPLEITSSRLFPVWLGAQKASLIFTTYQVGKVFTISASEGKLQVSERTFPRCMGIGVSEDRNTFWMSSLFQIWRFENSLGKGSFEGFDKVYLPQAAYTTGDLDIHDIIVGKSGKPVFVNTLFNCLATSSETHSFRPLWKPPFISRLVPEDRCHLNGLADIDGEPAYASMVGTADVIDGWRSHRTSGGVIMDVRTNEIVCEGLSMPHSPRWYKGELYLLEAGTGYFGKVNFATKSFERITFCPGFLRGLDFIGNYAVVGMSSMRKNSNFKDLPLEDNLKGVKAEAKCGLHIINLETGAVEQWVRIEGVIEELYDVRVLNGVMKPLLIGTKKDEIRTMVSIED